MLQPVCPLFDDSFEAALDVDDGTLLRGKAIAATPLIDRSWWFVDLIRSSVAQP